MGGNGRVEGGGWWEGMEELREEVGGKEWKSRGRRLVGRNGRVEGGGWWEGMEELREEVGGKEWKS